MRAFGLAPPIGEPVGEVLVKKINENYRTKHFDDVDFVVTAQGKTPHRSSEGLPDYNLPAER